MARITISKQQLKAYDNRQETFKYIFYQTPNTLLNLTFETHFIIKAHQLHSILATKTSLARNPQTFQLLLWQPCFVGGMGVFQLYWRERGTKINGDFRRISDAELLVRSWISIKKRGTEVDSL